MSLFFLITGFLGDESFQCFKESQALFFKEKTVMGLIDSIAKEQRMYLRECTEQ